MAGRVFGPDHFHRAAVAVEIQQPFRRHAADLHQRRIKDQGVLRRRENEAVQVRRTGTVKGGARRRAADAVSRHTRKRAGQERLRRAELEHLDVERGEDFGGRAGLAEVAAAVADDVLQDAAANAPRDPPGIVLPRVLGIGRVSLPGASCAVMIWAARKAEFVGSYANPLIAQLEDELSKDLGALIRRGEDDSLEFKSSFRYDYRLQKVNKALEAVIVKTLAGFMNTEGGSLLIGVADDGSIIGLVSDFQTLQRKDSDGYTQALMSTVAERLGTPACRLLRILFHRQDGKEVCRIIVTPSPVPVYAKEDKQSKFYIRTGSGTREIDLQDAVGFIKRKWG